jgi:hypothetical protein
VNLDVDLANIAYTDTGSGAFLTPGYRSGLGKNPNPG